MELHNATDIFTTYELRKENDNGQVIYLVMSRLERHKYLQVMHGDPLRSTTDICTFINDDISRYIIFLIEFQGWVLTKGNSLLPEYKMEIVFKQKGV